MKTPKVTSPVAFLSAYQNNLNRLTSNDPGIALVGDNKLESILAKQFSEMSATLQDEPLRTLDVEELAPVTFRRAVEATSDSERQLKSLLARGYSGTHEQSTPFHSFLEHSTLFLFPFVFGPALYVSLARLY